MMQYIKDHLQSLIYNDKHFLRKEERTNNVCKLQYTKFMYTKPSKQG